MADKRSSAHQDQLRTSQILLRLNRLDPRIASAVHVGLIDHIAISRYHWNQLPERS